MDLNKALSELYEEKKRLDRAIARIEARLEAVSGTPKRSTRGRKEMGAEERLKVSARMTAYWEARRQRQELAKIEAKDDEIQSQEEPEKENGTNGVSA